MPIVSLIAAAIESGVIKDKLHLKGKTGWLTFGLWIANLITTPFATVPLLIVLSATGVLDSIGDAINSNTRNNNQPRYNQDTRNINGQGTFNPNINQQPGANYYNSFGQMNGSNSKGTARPGYNVNSKNFKGKVSNPYDLPRAERGRSKIIEKFNDKYDLCLTSNDVKTMSSATYMSIEWASEVYAMQQKYDSVYEWLGQGNIWLRVYLYAFNVQNISPVFNKQEELVYNAFNTIFSEMCTDESLPTEIIIENINNKYMTRFDEASFLLAISYMESKGRHFKFGSPILTRVTSDIEDLEKKYQRMQ